MCGQLRETGRTTFLPLVLLVTCILGTQLAAGEQASTLASGGGPPLVSLDADKLPEGPLASWQNEGSLKGSFRDDGTKPQVKIVDGVKAVVFSGRDHMTADIKASESITGDKAWTCIVRARSDDARAERAVVAWAPRPNNCLELEYGDAPKYGAVGTWNDPHTLGWGDDVPQIGRWHVLAYVYHGGRDGDLQAWCDGELRSSKKVTLATKPDKRFVLGGCMDGDDAAKPRYVHLFQGALASVRIYDRALSPVEIWNASGHTSAYPVAPERGATLETVMTTLTWAAGDHAAASYDIYVGTDQAVVGKAENTLPVGKAEEWQKVYKGNQSVTKDTPRYGPLRLDIAKAYYWRIDQCDAAGKVAQRGVVWKFSTDTGQATDPVPADRYIVVEGGKKELRWKPGKHAVRQNIYLGASAEEVLGKKTPDIAGLPATAASATLPLSSPALGKTYYWRVESVNPDNLSVTSGAVWSFRTVSKKLKVYLVAGQSNAVGCCSVNGLPANLRGCQKGAIIFVRGECRLGPYGWASLKEGLGSGFGDHDGRGTFGPELAFGACVAPARPDQVVAIIKCAWGATNLGAQWRPPSAGGKTGELYTGFVKAVREGLAALDPAFEPRISGMIWMQGESDSADPRMADDYAKNLTCLIQDLRAEMKRPEMPFVFAQISKAPAWDNPPNRGPQIRAAQLEVSKTVPHTATFATDDYKMCDPWHYDTAGMISLGERFAKAMKELEESAAGEVPKTDEAKRALTAQRGPAPWTTKAARSWASATRPNVRRISADRAAAVAHAPCDGRSAIHSQDGA